MISDDTVLEISLNRTIVELKRANLSPASFNALGLNRTIVELKHLFAFHFLIKSERLNRTIVELKLKNLERRAIKRNRVLIAL